MKTETTSLGKHLSTYKPKRGPQRILLGAGGVSLLIALIEFASVANKLLGGVDLSSRFARDSLLISGILSALAFMIAAALAALYYTQMKNRVDLYDGGFVHTDWRRSLAFRWDEISEVYEMPVQRRRATGGYHSQRVINYLYTVRRSDGQVAKFGGLENIAQLGKTIQRASAERLLPQALKTFAAGGSVSFGPNLSLNREGISDGSRRLPWTEVADIRVDRRNGVTILQKDKRMPWKFIGGHEIGNSVVFKAMIMKLHDERGIPRRSQNQGAGER